MGVYITPRSMAEAEIVDTLVYVMHRTQETSTWLTCRGKNDLVALIYIYIYSTIDLYLDYIYESRTRRLVLAAWRRWW